MMLVVQFTRPLPATIIASAARSTRAVSAMIVVIERWVLLMEI